MKKKLIASAVVSAVALSAVLPATAANPNAREGHDNVLDEASCWPAEDGIYAGWYDPNGGDYFAGDTKYGGDLEVEAELSFSCENLEFSSEGSETATVDVDLSQDESDPFWYSCESVEMGAALCVASILWEDLEIAVNDAAHEFFADEKEACEGEFTAFGATLEDSTAHFGVKEMSPGKNKGRQNYEKANTSCDILPPDPS